VDNNLFKIKRGINYLKNDYQNKAGAKEKEEHNQFLIAENWQRKSKYVFVKRHCFENPFIEILNSSKLNSYFLKASGNAFPLSSVLFFDIETTGLSGGAGNMIFLIGLGWFKNENLHIEQVFLNDFPGEPDFIRYLLSFFSLEKLYVSYNGKGFDSHILRNRCLLNGCNLQILHQLDLLYFARRFWRKMTTSCSLNAIEREIMGIKRTVDIPGYEVPQTYLDYLNKQDAGLMPLVFEHNLQDIVSLAKLLFIVERIIVFDDSLVEYDPVGKGLFFMENNPGKALVCLKRAFKNGDMKAGKLLGDHYKRRRNWQEALDIWSVMCKKKSVYAYLELAKYYEHREKNLKKALYWTQELEKTIRLFGGNRDPLELGKRKNRILIKMERIKNGK
jgi:uncharacterized protein YprB with RNaseH-like and TPR domain